MNNPHFLSGLIKWLQLDDSTQLDSYGLDWIGVLISHGLSWIKKFSIHKSHGELKIPNPTWSMNNKNVENDLDAKVSWHHDYIFALKQLATWLESKKLSTLLLFGFMHTGVLWTIYLFSFLLGIAFFYYGERIREILD